MSEGYSKSNLSIRNIFKITISSIEKVACKKCHFFDGHVDTIFENLKWNKSFWDKSLNDRISIFSQSIFKFSILKLSILTIRSYALRSQRITNTIRIFWWLLSIDYQIEHIIEILTLHIPNTIILFQINSWSLIFRFISTGQWISPIIAVLHDFNPIQWRPIHLLGHYHEAVELFARDGQLDPIELKIRVGNFIR